MTEHIHQIISPITFRSATSNPFKTSAHSVLDVCSYILTYTKIRTPLQQTALNSFTSERLSIFNLGVYSRYSDSEIVRAYFSLFDQLYFFSSLQEKCEVNLVERTGLGLNDYTIQSLDLPNGDILSKISIHILHEFEDYERKERLKTYLGILLHEMIHVFLLTYSCRTGGCAGHLLGIRKLWHGEAWQDIAFAVETTVGSLLGLEVDSLRKWSAVTELCLSEESVENVAVERWGFRSDVIEELASCFGARVRKEATMKLEFIRWARHWSDG